ncbi:proline reductase-associated electron transfer protein PrdC [Vagococcus acidifermentans]|uniref:Proline reductase-associated electron transfer protein PrdC n=2 Tax=Vagococcus acidifermentans TaxID=564710 RepID=A0A430B254_9ENTE|nr:proline reductase-associated electron transfer protein PrdC [Vagococcus acidifermentans]
MKKLHIPLKQHVGGPCVPVVKVDEAVKRGQLIAEPSGLGANIHASMSGVIAEINDTEIVIQLDDSQSTDFVPIPETESKLEAIEAAGIVGAGGAGFPAHIKLKADIPDGTVIANGAECEALLQHNVKQIVETSAQLVRGVQYLMEITNAPRGIIAVKDKNRQAVIELLKATKDIPEIDVFRLPDIYPAGDERMIIREVLDIVLNPGQLPIEVGAVVSNVETIKHIVEAIELRKPFIDKDVTVAGRVQAESLILKDVPIGTPAKELIDQAGGYVHPHGEIVFGGPMTGMSRSENSPIIKTTGGVLVAMPYPQEHRKVGLLICECGGSNERLTEIATNMGAEVVAAERCKRMVEVNGRYRCELPGICPGQAETVMKMKKAGAEVVIVGSCSD